MPSERRLSSEVGSKARLGELDRGHLHTRKHADRLIPGEAEVTGRCLAHRFHLLMLSESVALLDAACTTTTATAMTARSHRDEHMFVVVAMLG